MAVEAPRAVTQLAAVLCRHITTLGAEFHSNKIPGPRTEEKIDDLLGSFPTRQSHRLFETWEEVVNRREYSAQLLRSHFGRCTAGVENDRNSRLTLDFFQHDGQIGFQFRKQTQISKYETLCPLDQVHCIHDICGAEVRHTTPGVKKRPLSRPIDRNDGSGCLCILVDNNSRNVNRMPAVFLQQHVP